MLFISEMVAKLMDEPSDSKSSNGAATLCDESLSDEETPTKKIKTKK